jgi:DNA mismatch endonuclease (patch repair protein)
LRNKHRDRRVTKELKQKGWKVVRVWECSLKKRPGTTTSRIQRAMNSKQ